jgi:hypothetical protein
MSRATVANAAVVVVVPLSYGSTAYDVSSGDQCSSRSRRDESARVRHTVFLEPAKSAFDNDKQEIIKKKNKKPSDPQTGDVTVTPPAKEDPTNTYTKFYELLTSKTSGESSATLKLPLEFSEYSNYVQANFGEFNTDKDKASGRIANVISTLDQSRSTDTIETLKSISDSSLNLFFALLFFRCMKGEGDKNMDDFKLERALTNLSLDKINDIIQALRDKNAGYSFVDIIDILNEQLLNDKSRLAIEIDPSSHDNPRVRASANLDPNFDVGGSSSKSKKNRKSHKSYHPDIGKTKKHHHRHHKKISFVH